MLEVRRQEMRQLAIIKLLDAFCVFSWACTSLLFAVFTLSLFAALDHKLEPTIVFTTVRTRQHAAHTALRHSAFYIVECMQQLPTTRYTLRKGFNTTQTLDRSVGTALSSALASRVGTDVGNVHAAGTGQCSHLATQHAAGVHQWPRGSPSVRAPRAAVPCGARGVHPPATYTTRRSSCVTCWVTPCETWQ